MNFVNEIILLNPQEKAFFRKLEKVQTKIIKCKYSIIFNKTCLKENIFPRYSNLRLHDQAARNQQFTLEFRSNLIKFQIDEK